MPTTLQADCTRPERVIVAHPFNPVYLIPLVEIVGGQSTSSAVVKTSGKILSFYQNEATCGLNRN